MKKILRKIVNIGGFEITPLKKNSFPRWPKNKETDVVLYEGDLKFHELYNIAQQKTDMTSTDNALRRLRHYTLNQLLLQSITLDGDIVECGTFHGLGAFQIASKIRENNLEKLFHIFDSFEGLSEVDKEDEAKLTISNNELRRQFAYSLENVKNNLSEFSFIKYYKGWIPDRFNEVKDYQFSFVHIDVDLYKPIYDSIDFFFPKLVDGGIMVFDDYGYTLQFPGAKKAVDESLEKFQYRFFLALPSGQAFVIK